LSAGIETVGTAYLAPDMNAFAERWVQGIGNELIPGNAPSGHGDVVVHERLGGLLSSYHRAAA